MGASHQSMARLDQLPEELIDTICGYLGAEVRKVRLVCRALKDKSDHQFVVCHFHTVQIMNTYECLQMLVRVAKNKRYGPRIKELQLCLVKFPDSAMRLIPDNPMTDEEKNKLAAILVQQKSRNVDNVESSPIMEEIYERILKKEVKAYLKSLRRQRRRLYRCNQEHQFIIRRQGIDVELLTEALRNLPALDSISVVDEFMERNRPWGARQLRQEIGLWPVTQENKQAYWKHCSHALALIFGALVGSGAKLKKAFTMNGALYNFAVPSTPKSRRLQPASTPAKTFSESQISELRPAFTELKELALHAYAYNEGKLRDLRLDSPFHWLQAYLPLWTSVQVFSISGAMLVREVAILKLLSSSTNIFPQLQHLSIASLCFNVQDLVTFITDRISTLARLRVYNCHAGTGDYRPIVSIIRESTVMVHLDFEVDGNGRYYNPPFGRRLNPEELRFQMLQVRQESPAEFQVALEQKLSNKVKHPITDTSWCSRAQLSLLPRN